MSITKLGPKTRSLRQMKKEKKSILEVTCLPNLPLDDLVFNHVIPIFSWFSIVALSCLLLSSDSRLFHADYSVLLPDILMAFHFGYFMLTTQY